VPNLGFAVPSRFTATFENLALPSAVPAAKGEPSFQVKLDVEVDALGRARCTGVAVSAVERDATIRRDLLRIPVGSLVKQATGIAGSWWRSAGRAPDGGRRFDLHPDAEAR
jgi:hypothetical protein